MKYDIVCLMNARYEYMWIATSDKVMTYFPRVWKLSGLSTLPVSSGIVNENNGSLRFTLSLRFLCETVLKLRR